MSHLKSAILALHSNKTERAAKMAINKAVLKDGDHNFELKYVGGTKSLFMPNENAEEEWLSVSMNLGVDTQSNFFTDKNWFK